MKKNGTLIIVAVVALAAGYLLGCYTGNADSCQTKGDINAINNYHQLLTTPEYMAFNKSMSGNEEAMERTISTLQIVKQRITDFQTITTLMNTMSANEPEVAPFVEQFLKSEKEGLKALQHANQALEAAQQLNAGEKVDTKKAMKNAEAALAYLNTQMSISKQYVQAVDKYLQGKNIQEHILTATIRDLVVSHCIVNATLVQNDSETDYWSNINGLVQSEDMAFTLE